MIGSEADLPYQVVGQGTSSHGIVIHIFVVVRYSVDLVSQAFFACSTVRVPTLVPSIVGRRWLGKADVGVVDVETFIFEWVAVDKRRIPVDHLHLSVVDPFEQGEVIEIGRLSTHHDLTQIWSHAVQDTNIGNSMKCWTVWSGCLWVSRIDSVHLGAHDLVRAIVDD